MANLEVLAFCKHFPFVREIVEYLQRATRMAPAVDALPVGEHLLRLDIWVDVPEGEPAIELQGHRFAPLAIVANDGDNTWEVIGMPKKFLGFIINVNQHTLCLYDELRRYSLKPRSQRHVAGITHIVICTPQQVKDNIPLPPKVTVYHGDLQNSAFGALQNLLNDERLRLFGEEKFSPSNVAGGPNSATKPDCPACRDDACSQILPPHARFCPRCGKENGCHRTSDI